MIKREIEKGKEKGKARKRERHPIAIIIGTPQQIRSASAALDD